MTINAAQAISAMAAATDRSGACAAFCHEVAVKFGSKTPSVAGPTAWNVAEASDIQNLPVAQAPANSFIWFKQKPGHAIMGYAPPEPGHVMFDPNGGGLDAISITDFGYGPLVGGTHHLRQGSVYTYLEMNPGVEYVGFSADYAGSVVSPPVTPTERVVGKGGATERTAPNRAAKSLGVAIPGGVIDFAGYVAQTTPHDPSVVVEVVEGAECWLYSKGGAFFSVVDFPDNGTHDLPDLTAQLFPVPAPPAPRPPSPQVPTPTPATPEPAQAPPDYEPVITPADPVMVDSVAPAAPAQPWWVALVTAIWQAITGKR